MQSLPAALAGLAAYAQFVPYILVPSKTRPGKTDKFPMNWRENRVWNAHDRNIWLTADAAFAQVAAGVGHGVGFVFADTDPFFFIDIDAALTVSGEWSPLAMQLCAAFPGAAVEVSQSGAGLHIIGRGTCPPHSCDYNVLGSGAVQFYTEGRFVALTGLHAQGDVNADMSYVLPWLVQHFFPYVEPVQPADWERGPRDDWRGPVDDDDLIRRAIRSQSAAAVFGSKASFADLWEENIDVLSKMYPSDSGDTYGRSHVDAAMASHLAFWTGCDCARIERIMRRSPIVRDKWDEYRPGGTYLSVTISKAVSVQRDVCHDKEVALPGVAAPSAPAPMVPGSVPPPDAMPGTAAPANSGVARTGATFLHPAQQVELFAGCVYVQENHRVFVPDGSLLKPDQFKAWYGGHVFVMDANNEKTTRSAWEAFTESNVITFPRVNRAWFRPDLPPGGVTIHEGLAYVNTYVPVNVARVAGDPTPMLQHMEKVLPNARDREILLAYMAACVQHVGVKFQWAPMLQGFNGNGKSLFSRCVEKAIGERYSHWPRADQISNKFNAWLAGRLFIGVEDVYLADGQEEVIEILKPIITSDRQSVELKGVDQSSTYVWCNLILNTNHRKALVKAKQGDGRRIAPFLTAQQTKEDMVRDGMTGNYFPSLYRWLKEQNGYAIVADYLYRYAIPAELNPAIDCSVAPDTSTSSSVSAGYVGGIEQEVEEAIGAERPGFMGGWISSFAFDGLLAKINRQRTLTHHQREEILNGMGYVKHPALPGGRVNNIVAPDAGKPILFIKTGSPELNITAPAEVARAYSAAQGVTFSVASPIPPPTTTGTNTSCH